MKKIFLMVVLFAWTAASYAQNWKEIFPEEVSKWTLRQVKVNMEVYEYTSVHTPKGKVPLLKLPKNVNQGTRQQIQLDLDNRRIDVSGIRYDLRIYHRKLEGSKFQYMFVAMEKNIALYAMILSDYTKTDGEKSSIQGNKKFDIRLRQKN